MYQKGCRVKDKRLRGAAIAQWIRLNLPSAAPGSSPKHTIYAFFNCSNYTSVELECEKYENK